MKRDVIVNKAYRMSSKGIFDFAYHNMETHQSRSATILVMALKWQVLIEALIENPLMNWLEFGYDTIVTIICWGIDIFPMSTNAYCSYGMKQTSQEVCSLIPYIGMDS